MCGCECCISSKSIHYSLLSWRDCYKKLKSQSQNSQNRRSGEKENHIYETYKNTVITHGRHIYDKASDVAKATMCSYPHSDHALPHWNCVLRCCAKCPYVNPTDQETDYQYSDTTPSICFHIYHLIARTKAHGMLPLNGKTVFRICKQDYASEKFTKIDTIK